jgi:hypothetical protein
MQKGRRKIQPKEEFFATLIRMFISIVEGLLAFSLSCSQDDLM